MTSVHRRDRARRWAAVAATALLLACGSSGAGDGAADPLRRETTTTTTTTPPSASERRTGATAPGVVDLDLLQERAGGTPPLGTTEAYAGVPFADALQAEQRALPVTVPHPVGGVAYDDFAGSFTTVTGRVRSTRAPTCGSCARSTVWLVGGSAAFGLGQRDDHTIASRLVVAAEADGLALEVVNASVPGWTSWQELQGVLALLAAGEPPPDLVISYGGFNDLIGVLFESIATGEMPRERPTVWDPRYGGGVLDVLTAGGDARPSRRHGVRSGERSGGVAAQTRALLEPLGIETLFVFQPDALASEGQRRDVVGWIGPVFRSDVLDEVLTGLDDALGAAAEATGRRADGLNLRHLFDGHTAVYFPDMVHTNEPGAALVAEAIWARARPLLVGD